jgi:early secretory antigenic target protein ESAT-6
MTLIQVNYASLDDGALTLNGLNSKLNQLITDLETAMKPVLASWDGEAMTTYTQRKAEWDTATNELTGLVAQFGKAVDEANQHHQATEKKIVSSLS